VTVALVASLVLAQPHAFPPTDRVLSAGELELRVAGGTNFVLFNVTLGGSADIGVARLGPGTLAIGAGYDAVFCASYCEVVALLTGLNYNQQYSLPSARVAYHFIPFPANPTLKNVDIYLLAMGGPAWVKITARDADGPVYRGDAFSWWVGGSGGIQYFFGPVLFAGFEFRLRWGQGTAAISDQAERYTFKQEGLETRWLATGFTWLGVVGVRL
jgi:hypothetical protein